MKYKVIACEVLARPLYLCAARSPHIVDIELVQKGLHERPTDLRTHLQASIDAADGKGYDALLLGYGLCGQALAGLTAGGTQLVAPRAHDCITLFLGSRARYQEQFDNYPGTYWYAQDYVERTDGTSNLLSMGSSTDIEVEKVYGEYVQKYGKDNADYLMEAMGAWQRHYRRAVYVDMGVEAGTAVEERAKSDALRRGWSFERLEGDMLLIRRLLVGDWQGDFLVVQPGQVVQMSYDHNIIQCVGMIR
jgi:hypothetical protein